jgi:hypothetical protein
MVGNANITVSLTCEIFIQLVSVPKVFSVQGV